MTESQTQEIVEELRQVDELIRTSHGTPADPEPDVLFEGLRRLDALLFRCGVFHGLPAGLGYQTVTPAAGFPSQLLNSIVEGMVVENPSPESKPAPSAEEEEEYVLHTQWRTKVQWQGDFGTVYVYRHKTTGRYSAEFIPLRPQVERGLFVINTIHHVCHFTFAKSEEVARQNLLKKLTESQRRTFFLTDSVLEEGRSGVLYLIRKNRPTLAIKNKLDGEGNEKGAQVLCALCLHPLAYYSYSWAGTMAPSDDMLSHLLMIRGDEHFYWRKANQIPSYESASGI